MAAEAAEADHVRHATADLTDVERVVPRVAPLRALVAWAAGVQQARGPLPAAPDQARPRFEAAWALAQRVVADRAEPDHGDPVRRVGEPDARRGTPGPSGAGSRLASSLEAESARRTALNVLPGHGDEARDPSTRLAAAAQAQGQTVAAVSSEGMGGHGAGWRALRAPEGLGVAVDVPPSPPPALDVFGPAVCGVDPQQGVVPCPGGHQTATTTRHAPKTGWQFGLARRPWLGCALHAQGLTRRSPQTGRRGSKQEDQAEDDAARARATTPASTVVL